MAKHGLARNYIAALSGISQELHEATVVDGANKLRWIIPKVKFMNNKK